MKLDTKTALMILIENAKHTAEQLVLFQGSQGLTDEVNATIAEFDEIVSELDGWSEECFNLSEENDNASD